MTPGQTYVLEFERLSGESDAWAARRSTRTRTVLFDTRWNYCTRETM